MLQYVVLLVCVISTLSENSDELVTNLRDDANLDLSTDLEYEDLRAELLASHTALAKLIGRENLVGNEDARRSRRLLNTPCWNLSGICVNSELCYGYKFLTEVRGCRDKHRVCCFVWNKFNVRDMSQYGFSNLAMPWSLQQDFGQGGGIVEIDTKIRKRKSKRPKKLRGNKTGSSEDKAVALLLRLNK